MRLATARRADPWAVVAEAAADAQNRTGGHAGCWGPVAPRGRCKRPKRVVDIPGARDVLR